MKKTNKYTTETYTSGKYIVECVDYIDEEREAVMDVWLSRKGVAHKLFMFGLPYVQPFENHRYTREELLEIVEANLPDYKKFYEEELVLMEEAFHAKYDF